MCIDVYLILAYVTFGSYVSHVSTHYTLATVYQRRHCHLGNVHNGWSCTWCSRIAIALSEFYHNIQKTILIVRTRYIFQRVLFRKNIGDTNLQYWKKNQYGKWNRFDFWNSCKRLQNFVNVKALLLTFLEKRWASKRENLYSGLVNNKGTVWQTSLCINAVWSAPLLLAYWKVSYKLATSEISIF